MILLSDDLTRTTRLMLNAVKKMLLQSISLRHPQDERSTREKIYKDTMFSKDWVCLYRMGNSPLQYPPWITFYTKWSDLAFFGLSDSLIVLSVQSGIRSMAVTTRNGFMAGSNFCQSLGQWLFTLILSMHIGKQINCFGSLKPATFNLEWVKVAGTERCPKACSSMGSGL
jgi:hypothetical protein